MNQDLRIAAIHQQLARIEALPLKDRIRHECRVYHFSYVLDQLQEEKERVEQAWEDWGESYGHTDGFVGSHHLA